MPSWLELLPEFPLAAGRGLKGLQSTVRKQRLRGLSRHEDEVYSPSPHGESGEIAQSRHISATALGAALLLLPQNNAATQIPTPAPTTTLPKTPNLRYLKGRN